MFVIRIPGVFLLPAFMLAVCAAATINAENSEDAALVRQHRVALHRLEVAALRSHPSVLAAQATLEGAGHDATAALWQFFPTPGVNASKSKDSPDSSVTFSLRQPIYSGGRLTTERDKALAARRIAESSLEEARFTLSLNTISAYGSLIENRMVENIYRAGLKDLSALRAIIRKRVTAKISPESDALLTETRYAAIESNFHETKTDLDGDYERFAQLVGKAVTEADIGNVFVSDFAAPPLTTLQKSVVVHVLECHPKIQRLRAQRDQTRSAVEMAKSAWTPNISLQWGYTHHSQKRDQDGQSIELVLSSNFSAGLSDRSHLLSAKAAQKAASDEVLSAERDLRQSLSQLFTSYRSLYGKADRLSENVARLDSLLANYRSAFLIGRRSWLDVLNMLRESIQTRAELARIQVKLFVSAQTLKRYQELGDNHV